MRRRILIPAIAAVALIGAELAARAAFDFPLYGADSEVGYWPLPNQQGTFLFSNDWAFNSDGLGVSEQFAPSDKIDVLLVGDSLVYGGNEFRQRDKLGPKIEQRTGWQVWPAGAGSWGLQNELAFLRRKPHLVAGADAIVVITNSGDFARPSEWTSPYTHPRARPGLYLAYLFRRYLLKPTDQGPPPFPVPQRDVMADWLGFARSVGKPLVVLAYSTRSEAGQDCAWVPSAFKRVGDWVCYDAARDIGPEAFRDDTHPSVLGNDALADRIVSALGGIEPTLAPR